MNIARKLNFQSLSVACCFHHREPSSNDFPNPARKGNSRQGRARRFVPKNNRTKQNCEYYRTAGLISSGSNEKKANSNDGPVHMVQYAQAAARTYKIQIRQLERLLLRLLKLPLRMPVVVSSAMLLAFAAAFGCWLPLPSLVFSLPTPRYHRRTTNVFGAAPVDYYCTELLESSLL